MAASCFAWQTPAISHNFNLPVCEVNGANQGLGEKSGLVGFLITKGKVQGEAFLVCLERFSMLIIDLCILKIRDKTSSECLPF